METISVYISVSVALLTLHVERLRQFFRNGFFPPFFFISQFHQVEIAAAAAKADERAKIALIIVRPSSQWKNRARASILIPYLVVQCILKLPLV